MFMQSAQHNCGHPARVAASVQREIRNYHTESVNGIRVQIRINPIIPIEIMPVHAHALYHNEMCPDALFLRALAELYNAAIYEI